MTRKRRPNAADPAPPQARIPPPAHPHRRRVPLPWNQPKPAEDDPDAPRRLQAILDSPGYRQADQDVEFLNRDETRGLRLQVDYFKPEMLLEEHGIHDTIVVVGSTRILEAGAARRQVATLREALASSPGDRDLAHQVEVAERVLANSDYYEVAREFGRLVGDGAGEAVRAVIMTGGGPGIMEAANRGAFDAGAKSIGLNITLPHPQFPNPYITPELCFRFHYFALRKLHFLLRARALVAFPGGYGTFDEVFEALALVQTRKIRPFPIVLVGERFWRRAFDVDFLVEEGVIEPEDRELFWFAETAPDILDGIRHWHTLTAEAQEVKAVKGS
ncbi:MAG: LOG family protein [Gemmatimonadota bacterium]